MAAAGGADRRSAKNAAAPMDQSREAHHSARPHHSPEGGQSPAGFAGDWPPSGALACGDADAEGEAGYAIGCGALAHLWRSFGAPLADPSRCLTLGRVRSTSRWAGLGCGAC